MNAIIWKDEALGAKFDIVEIPDDLKEKAIEYRAALVEAAVEMDDDVDGRLPRWQRAGHRRR